MSYSTLCKVIKILNWISTATANLRPSHGLLLIRYLFGFTGDALTIGAISEGAIRDTSEAVEAYISDRVPASE
jgi:hypothetical protein